MTHAQSEAYSQHDRFEPFTRQARRALILAHEEAQRLGHSAITPEHILLGIVKLDTGTGGTLLQALQIDPFKLHQRLERSVRRNDYRASNPNPWLLDPRSRRVLEVARREATGMEQPNVGTAHLLLGILLEQGPSADLLRRAGATLERVRHSVAEEVQPEGPATEAVEGVASNTNHAPDLVSVSCPVSPQMLDTLDLLVQAGIYATRSEAATALLGQGFSACRDLIGGVYVLADQIRRLRGPNP